MANHMRALHYYPLHDPHAMKEELLTHILLWDRIVFGAMYRQPPVSCLTSDELKELTRAELIEIRAFTPSDLIDSVKDHPVLRYLPHLASKERILGGTALMKTLNIAPYYRVTEQEDADLATSSIMFTWSTILSLYYYLNEGLSSVNGRAYSIATERYLQATAEILKEQQVPSVESPAPDFEASKIYSLMSLTLDAIGLSAATSVDKVIGFKKNEENRVLLAKYTSAVRELVATIASPIDSEDLVRGLKQVYDERVAPSVRDLEECLRDNNLDTIKSLLKTTAFVSGVSIAALGEYALLAAVPVNFGVEAINWTLRKRKILRDSPYSYVLLLKHQLSR